MRADDREIIRPHVANVMDQLILSYLQTQTILAAHATGQESIAVSLDLGLTTTEVRLDSTGVHLPVGQSLTFEQLREINQTERSCFRVEAGELYKIQFFSEETNRVYSLMPTQGAPTLLVSGISMHRISGVDPHEDAVRKVKAVRPVVGTVLDTATGLGYTAIEAAKSADQVITIELNEASLAIAKENPWSQPLFDNPKIRQVIGDSFEQIEAFEDEQFARIVHDPPPFSMAGELYSGEFYQQLYRTLSRRGRLYHYIGDLDSKTGRNNAIARGVIRRLQEAGFQRVVRQPAAFGVVAYK